MSEHSQDHEPFIKTPKQLIAVVVAGFVVPIAVAVMASQFVTMSRKVTPNEEDVARNIQPVAAVQLAAGGGGGAPKGAKTGEQVVQAVCGACHSSGAAGAPKIGDNAAWAPRLGLGLEGLTKSAIAGKNAMPARGGGADLTDTEIARAIAYMANKSGANFKEPAAPAGGEAAKAEAPKAEAPKAEAPKAEAAPAAAAPVAAAAPAAAPAKVDGKAVYDKVCAMCHAAGVAGAPKFGDKGQWAPRIAVGIDSLYTSAIKGKNAMPPKGANPALSEAEVKAAVDHMVAAGK